MFVADRTGANARQIFIEPRPGGHNHFPTWSPDGRWIYFVSGVWDSRETDVWRIAPSGGTPERLTRRSGDMRYISLLDNRIVLYVATEQDGSGPWLWALDVESRAVRRISSGLEKYTSLAASADGRRLVASVGNPSVNLWEVPLLDRQAEERDVKPFALPTVRAVAPRFGGNSLFYLSSTGAGDGLWRYRNDEALEIWKGAEGPLIAAPAVSPDGHRIAVAAAKQGAFRLRLVSDDGAESQPVAATIDVRGAACWSPDGQWIVTGGSDASGPGLFKIPVAGGAPIRLLSGPGVNPVWSPKDPLIVYMGPSVGNRAPLLAIRPDSVRVDLQSIDVNYGVNASALHTMAWVWCTCRRPGVRGRTSGCSISRR